MKQSQGGQYREEVRRIGGPDGLVGILCLPSQGADPAKPAALLLNAGMLHRVGPCRNTVTLARQLAQAGYASLRFDYAGTGDSPAAAGQAGAEALDNTAQVQQAMDYLCGAIGAKHFMVHGLCSGARDAFHAAVADSRIVAVSQVDSFSYRIPRFHLNRVLNKLGRPGSWWHSVRVRLAKPREANDSEVADDLSTTVWPAYPPRQELVQKYRQLVARGVKFFTVYTGSWCEVYNYANQYYDMFPVKGLAQQSTLLYLPQANHLFSDGKSRQSVYKALVQFADQLGDSLGAV